MYSVDVRFCRDCRDEKDFKKDFKEKRMQKFDQLVHKMTSKINEGHHPITVAAAALIEALDVPSDADQTDDELTSALEFEMPMGKYAGKKLRDIPKQYLDWFEQNAEPSNRKIASKCKIILDACGYERMS